MKSAESKSRDDSSTEGLSPGLAAIIKGSVQPGQGFKTQHVVAYILCAVLAREYTGWQPGLDHGFAMYGIAQLCTAFANFSYYMCLAEIWSAIPFSGGSYALSRATLGFYLGFLDGICEAMIYTIHAALAAMGLADKLCVLFEIGEHWSLLIVFVMFAICLALTIQPSLIVLRRSFMALAAIGITILLVYDTAAFKWTDFNQNASLHKSDNFSASENWINGGMSQFIRILPLTLLPYAGTRSYAILTSVTETPKRTLPRAIVIAFTIVFFLNMWTIFVNVAQPGGILHTSAAGNPMSVGWALIFNLHNKLTIFRTGALLYIPAAFAKVLAYLLPGGILLFSLGKSNLLPSVLCVNHSTSRVNGTVVLVLFSMFFCIIQHFYPKLDMYMVVVMLTKLTDCTFLYGYIQLRTTFSNIEREFTSPFGVPGAIGAFIIFVLTFISAGFYQGSYFPPEFLVAFFAAGSVYYWAFAKRTETLCEEEDQVFLKLHVRNYNIAKKKKKGLFTGGWRTKNRVTPGEQYKPSSTSQSERIVSGSMASGPRYGGNIINEEALYSNLGAIEEQSALYTPADKAGTEDVKTFSPPFSPPPERLSPHLLQGEQEEKEEEEEGQGPEGSLIGEGNV